MSGQVYFVKMTTGEEVIAELYRHHDDVVMRDPMQFEYSESDGKRFLFLSRYNPFIEEPTIRLHSRSVMFMKPVTDEVGRYYRSSVDYCRKVSDETFKVGIKQATSWTHEMLESPEGEAVEDDMPAPVNSTVH